MSQLGLGMTHDDPATSRKRRSPERGSNRAVVLALLAVGAVVVVAAFLGIRWLTAGDDFTGEGTGRVVVEVKKGDALRTIGATLADAGVVKSVDAFTSAASDEPKAKAISPGAYVLRLGMSGSAAVALMIDPASRDVAKVVVPEGLRMSQIVTTTAKATGLSEDALRDSLARASSLGLPAYAEGNPEGYLFPATYEFARDATADEVVKAMLARFRKAAEDSDLVERSQELGVTPGQAVALASIVQGEGSPNDYTKVSRVIYNRLHDGTRLQMDSTVNYGLGTGDLHLSQAQLATDTPYNTYLHKGLPPGAIGSPGDAALEAALQPEPGNWLYFITIDVKNQVTKFTASYRQFLRWKAEFQAASG